MKMSHLLQRSLGQRVSQTVSSVVTEYLLDVQPGLWKVIAADDGTNVSRYIHDPVTRGIHQHEGPSNDWNWMANDGLGSVRGVYDDTLAEVYDAQYAPYGDVWDSSGTNPTSFGYTGEPTDANDLVHLRARYYDPGLGAFFSQDPLETENRYAYVGGNPISFADPTGLHSESPSQWTGCAIEFPDSPVSLPSPCNSGETAKECLENHYCALFRPLPDGQGDPWSTTDGRIMVGEIYEAVRQISESFFAACSADPTCKCTSADQLFRKVFAEGSIWGIPENNDHVVFQLRSTPSPYGSAMFTHQSEGRLEIFNSGRGLVGADFSNRLITQYLVAHELLHIFEDRADPNEAFKANTSTLAPLYNAFINNPSLDINQPSQIAMRFYSRDEYAFSGANNIYLPDGFNNWWSANPAQEADPIQELRTELLNIWAWRNQPGLGFTNAGSSLEQIISNNIVDWMDDVAGVRESCESTCQSR
jgi:RHS repeat-associated protein